MCFLICNWLSDEAEKSSTWTTHRDKRTMILLIVRSRLKPNRANTLRITYGNELTHTHTIKRDVKWYKKKQKTKHNTGIHAQWCSTFTHTRIHMRHTHTKAEWEKKPLKTWNSHWITLTMTVEVDAPIQCYGQSAFIHFNALQRIFRCVSHVSHRMNNITGSLFICVICLRDSPSELCACEYKTCYVNDGAQNYEYWSMSSWSQGAHGI